MLTSIDEEHEAVVAQISWANECIENLQEEVVAFEDAKVRERERKRGERERARKRDSTHVALKGGERGRIDEQRIFVL